MSRIFYVAALISALAMLVLGASGCWMMMTGDELKTPRGQFLRVIDIVLFQGLFWTIKSFRAHWKVRHTARELICWSLGC